jgi:hypothetical protein
MTTTEAPQVAFAETAAAIKARGKSNKLSDKLIAANAKAAPSPLRLLSKNEVLRITGATYPTGSRPTSDQGRMVTRLAHEGHSTDVIAARLGVNMNTLRAQHALHLKAGRDAKAAEKAAAEAAELGKRERERLEHIEKSFASDWNDPVHGNLFYNGARSVAEALAWCDSFKGLKNGRAI